VSSFLGASQAVFDSAGAFLGEVTVKLLLEQAIFSHRLPLAEEPGAEGQQAWLDHADQENPKRGQSSPGNTIKTCVFLCDAFC
jgi:hypothetical protein